MDDPITGGNFCPSLPSNFFPEIAGPADDVIGIMAPDEVVVGDIEVAGSRVVREDTGADVLEPAVFHGDAMPPGTLQA